MALAAAATIAPLSMVFGCGAIVDTLPHVTILLEDLLAFMGSIEDQLEMALRGVLVHIP